MVINNAYIEITKRCNLLCPYCFNDSNSGPDLPMATLCSIIDTLKRHNVDEIILSGGEPFLYGDITDLIEYIKSKNIKKLRFITNGTAISTEVIRMIKRHSIEIQLSFNNEKSKMPNMQKSICQKQIETLKKMKIAGIEHISLRAMIYKSNIDSIDKIVEIAQRYNIRDLYYMLLFSRGRLRKNTSIMLSPQEQYKMYKRIIVLKDMFKDSITIHEPKIFCGKCGFLASEQVMNIAIDHSGNVFPCNALCDKQYSLGKFNADSFEQLFVEDNFSRIANAINEARSICKSCAVQAVCNKACPTFRNESETEFDEYCKLRKLQIMTNSFISNSKE